MKDMYNIILNECKDQAKIVVVSKKRSIDEIMAYYQQGVRDFGENRAEELVEKAQQLPKDIRWHFIGHLQRNKVKQILPYTAMIHSVASLELIHILEKEAAKLNCDIPVLIQFNLAQEPTKSGLQEQDAYDFINQALLSSHVHLSGIMCMGPHTEDQAAINAVFHKASLLRKQLQAYYHLANFKECSMGMSNDWSLALKNGATLLRIGTILFE